MAKAFLINTITQMRTEIEVVEVTLSAGQTINSSEAVMLPDGHCSRMAVAVIDGDVTKNVNISLKTSGGNDIVKPHTHKLWEQRQGGDYFDSLKPVDFTCGRKIVPVLAAPAALAADVTFQFVFYVATKE